jgi:hypothetical protein
MTPSIAFQEGHFMNSPRYLFARLFAGTVVAALLPVILVAFLTIPFNLGGHPGETRIVTMLTPTHMT